MGTEEGMSALKAAELELRKAVEVHGTHHPVVLAQLETYVRVCREQGQEAQAQKLEAKAEILRKALGALGDNLGIASPAAAATAQSAAPNAPTPTPAPPPAGLPQASLAPAEAAPTPARANTVELEPESDFMSTSASVAARGRTVELESEADFMTSAASSAPASGGTVELESEEAFASPVAAQAPVLDRYTEKHLYNSKGEHIAVAFDGDLYSPSGKHLARWEEDLSAYIDDRGWYFGEIVDGNRIASNSTWHYKHMNFGTKATAGHRSGWQRQSDTSRTMLPSGFSDIVFPEE
jgi:hypothetical protein